MYMYIYIHVCVCVFTAPHRIMVHRYTYVCTYIRTYVHGLIRLMSIDY